MLTGRSADLNKMEAGGCKRDPGSTVVSLECGYWRFQGLCLIASMHLVSDGDLMTREIYVT
ncbi:hypothetical protein BDW71DRAFT_170243 [Aspergillus fruticulosus]